MKKQTRISILVLALALVFTTGCLGIFGSKEFGLSGYVTDEEGLPIEGVTLTVVGEETDLVIEEFGEDGKWQATAKGEVTVTPFHENYTFEPESSTVRKQNDKLNFVGTIIPVSPVGPYTIGGTVTEDGQPLEGVTIAITGETETTVITNEQGKWEIEIEGIVTVTPKLALYAFEPESKLVYEERDDIDFVASPAPGLIAHYEFDSDEGDIAVDSTGNGFHATIHGNANYVQGVFGKAISHEEDTGLWVELPQGVFGDGDTITISFWINFQEWVPHARPFTVMGELDLELNSVLSLDCYDFGDGGWVATKYLTNDVYFLPLNPTGWNQVVLTFDGNVGKGYFNGGLREEQELDYLFSEAFENFKVGGLNFPYRGNPQAVAYFDDFRIYNYALTGEEVEALYNEGI